MSFKEKNSLKWYEFKLFKPFKNLSHAILTSAGGQGENGQLNLNLEHDNCPDEVLLNLQKVQSTFGIRKIAWAKQVHATQINHITQIDRSSQLIGDALVTQEKGIALLIKHADCQAALFYDPIEEVIANVHCGFRGNVLNIYKKTIDFMKLHFGCKAQNIRVCVSPSLGPKHAEFINYQKEFPKSLWKYRNQNNYFDLWAIARDQLKQEGIDPKHIEIAQIDTYSSASNFFSYRKERTKERNASFIMLH